MTLINGFYYYDKEKNKVERHLGYRQRKYWVDEEGWRWKTIKEERCIVKDKEKELVINILKGEMFGSIKDNKLWNGYFYA